MINHTSIKSNYFKNKTNPYKLCINWITNKNLLYTTGNPTQYSVMAYLGKETKKRGAIGIHVTDSLCYTPETHTTLYINYIPINCF